MNERFSEQESFLDRLIDEGASVSVFLINGIRLSGTIQSYDRTVVLLGSPSGIQAVFKHSVSTNNGPSSHPLRMAAPLHKPVIQRTNGGGSCCGIAQSDSRNINNE
ncbi:RNA chaperone Hfq [Paraburkholderia hospita]|uniref:RNA chaperone Hfq n=1 Tax=Paraburkholderia hospita TaxID=169430 RepID=UPI000271C6D2|nr:RNA chaperone Hfq [Paraburkholderia hospita]EUC14633.1 hypothetical protein PMI06_006459 [Burkholderia sp. BT03]SKC62763.1 RNA chaperone Hfq [Paraburkholderia hospita]SKC94110.1 RNA chaperone Hfq [Paraburkholderia hospita]